MFRIRWMIRLIALSVIAVVAARGFYWYFGIVDPISVKLDQRVHEEVALHHGTYVPLSAIPGMFRWAVIATEDARFNTDPGIDPIGIVRSIAVDVSHDAFSQGGSTITQQLVRSALLQDQSRTVTRKLKEMALAVAVYQHVSKLHTFELYANDVYYGHGAYGIGAAARTYFGKSPDRLTAGEATLLAGLPNAPSAYDPFSSLNLARQRQQQVISRMVSAGYITQSEADEIARQPLLLDEANR